MVYGAIVISVIGGYLNIAATPGISGWLSPGIIWAIFSCFSLVVLMVLTEFLSRRYHATAIATVQQITGTVVATAVLVLLALSRHRPFFPSLTATAWLQALILGTACGALYGLLITATLRYLTATTLSTWMYIEPSLATLFASWWYHEGLAPLAIVGCLMIILGGVTIAKVGH
jgi:drug/metabolite transporter (DMT)-like permease